MTFSSNGQHWHLARVVFSQASAVFEDVPSGPSAGGASLFGRHRGLNMWVPWVKNGRTGVCRAQTGKVMYGSKLKDRAESALLQMKQVLEGRLWLIASPLSGHPTTCRVNKWSVASKHGPCSELLLVSRRRKSRMKMSVRFFSTPIELHDFMRVVEQEAVPGYLRECGLVHRSDPARTSVVTKKGRLTLNSSMRIGRSCTMRLCR